MFFCCFLLNSVASSICIIFHFMKYTKILRESTFPTTVFAFFCTFLFVCCFYFSNIVFFQPTWNQLKRDLISKLMPTFLGQHSNSAVILHYAWHHQVKNIKKSDSFLTRVNLPKLNVSISYELSDLNHKKIHSSHHN